MRGAIKSVLRWLWRLWSPLRRPFSRKFNAYLAEQLQYQLKPVVQIIAEQNGELRELNLCAENTIRELIRLQEQFEAALLTPDGAFSQSPGDWSVTAPATAPVNSSQAA
ncbi:MAG TPA: hypothetical protein VND64_04620 [Pirellulales bacterium]|nr:hypothetical protein [Pirellulales bacterium]